MEIKEILIKLTRLSNMSENQIQLIKDEWEKLELSLDQMLHSEQVPAMFRPLIQRFLDELLGDFRRLMK